MVTTTTSELPDPGSQSTESMLSSLGGPAQMVREAYRQIENQIADATDQLNRLKDRQAFVARKIAALYAAVVDAKDLQKALAAQPYDDGLLFMLKRCKGGWESLRSAGAADAEILRRLNSGWPAAETWMSDDRYAAKPPRVWLLAEGARRYGDPPSLEGGTLAAEARRLLEIPTPDEVKKHKQKVAAAAAVAHASHAKKPVPKPKPPAKKKPGGSSGPAATTKKQAKLQKMSEKGKAKYGEADHAEAELQQHNLRERFENEAAASSIEKLEHHLQTLGQSDESEADVHALKIEVFRAELNKRRSAAAQSAADSDDAEVQAGGVYTAEQLRVTALTLEANIPKDLYVGGAIAGTISIAGERYAVVLCSVHTDELRYTLQQVKPPWEWADRPTQNWRQRRSKWKNKVAPEDTPLEGVCVGVGDDGDDEYCVFTADRITVTVPRDREADRRQALDEQAAESDIVTVPLNVLGDASEWAGPATTDPNVNEHGVYVRGVRTIHIPIAASHKSKLKIEVVQGADGKWRSAYGISIHYATSAHAPSLKGEAYETEAQAIRAAAADMLAQVQGMARQSDTAKDLVRCKAAIAAIEVFLAHNPAAHEPASSTAESLGGLARLAREYPPPKSDAVEPKRVSGKTRAQMQAHLKQTGMIELVRRYKLHCPLEAIRCEDLYRKPHHEMVKEIIEAMYGPAPAQAQGKPKPNGASQHPPAHAAAAAMSHQPAAIGA